MAEVPSLPPYSSSREGQHSSDCHGSSMQPVHPPQESQHCAMQGGCPSSGQTMPASPRLAVADREDPGWRLRVVGGRMR